MGPVVWDKTGGSRCRDQGLNKKKGQGMHSRGRNFGRNTEATKMKSPPGEKKKKPKKKKLESFLRGPGRRPHAPHGRVSIKNLTRKRMPLGDVAGGREAVAKYQKQVRGGQHKGQGRSWTKLRLRGGKKKKGRPFGPENGFDKRGKTCTSTSEGGNKAKGAWEQSEKVYKKQGQDPPTPKTASRQKKFGIKKKRIRPSKWVKKRVRLCNTGGTQNQKVSA